jgi:hypothetical protein
MSDYTVRIELKGRNFDREEYVQLHDLMEGEGFERKIDAQARKQTRPPGFMSPPPRMPSPLPHATYFGPSNLTASALLDHLVSRIVAEIQPGIVVFVAETLNYAIFPN